MLAPAEPPVAAPGGGAARAIADSASVSHEEVAQLAYEYYLERDGGGGTAEEDWYRAERALAERRNSGE